jgi:hypothetical protein
LKGLMMAMTIFMGSTPAEAPVPAGRRLWGSLRCALTREDGPHAAMRLPRIKLRASSPRDR